jgi:tetratricopeptide (TPR) repeat protein
MTKPEYDPRLLEMGYQHALRFYEAKSWSEAVKLLSAIVELNPDYRDAASLLEDAKMQLKLATLYEQARTLQSDGDWIRAFCMIEEIIAIDSSYKDARYWLDKLRSLIELDRLYHQALENMAREQWTDAIGILLHIIARDASYKDVTSLLRKATENEVQGMAAPAMQQMAAPAIAPSVLGLRLEIPPVVQLAIQEFFQDFIWTVVTILSTTVVGMLVYISQVSLFRAETLVIVLIAMIATASLFTLVRRFEETKNH